MGQKWAKNRVFRIHWKIWSLIFTEVVLYENLYYSLCSCINPIFGKMLVPEIWAKMFSANQIAEFFNQTYLKTNQWNSLMFCMLVQIQKTKIWSKSFWLGMVENGCGQSGHGTLKLTVSQEWIDGMNWFLHAGVNSGNLKVSFNDSRVGVFKNVCCHLVHEALESAVL